MFRRNYTTKGLVTCYRFMREDINGKRSIEVSWHQKMSAAEWLRWFRKTLHEKISSYERRTGRKFDDTYQLELRRDARLINDYFGKRLRHTGCRNILWTREMQERYPQVNTQEREI
jgi:sarcosine oxidase delta subunit